MPLKGRPLDEMTAESIVIIGRLTRLQPLQAGCTVHRQMAHQSMPAPIASETCPANAFRTSPCVGWMPVAVHAGTMRKERRCRSEALAALIAL
eukprot:1997438-Alexandrium_andersonii.AAC.1